MAQELGACRAERRKILMVVSVGHTLCATGDKKRGDGGYEVVQN